MPLYNPITDTVPAAHASTHERGGADEVDPSLSQRAANPGYHIDDDFEDNLLSGRDNFYFEDGLFKAHMRPEYVTVSGSPSASGGKMVLAAGDVTEQAVSCLSTFMVGTWEIDFAFAASPTAGYFAFRLISSASVVYADPSNNGYTVNVFYTGDFVLGRIDAGAGVTLIAGTWTVGTATVAIKVTRTAAGAFELFRDGVSQGTVTDTTYTSSGFLVPDTRANQEIRLDNLKVY